MGERKIIHSDGAVETLPAEVSPETEARRAALRARGRPTTDQARQDALRRLAQESLRSADDGALKENEALFDLWTPGQAYQAGDVVGYGGRLYRALAAHTAQADWTPDTAVSLFAAVQIPGDAPLTWIPGEIVQTGDIRLFEGGRYRCLQAHTTLAGWTPPVTPALWAIDD
ncbi:MAG: hypothetical protein LBT60_03470 [Oscillospiraceae bacterium]|jgi:hypothetical protein|nr:hypothetical protein [Oscillospiraceae bacterium]